MQLRLYPIPDKEGEYSVVKHLTFRDKVKPAYAVKFVQGGRATSPGRTPRSACRSGSTCSRTWAACRVGGGPSPRAFRRRRASASWAR
eukprot:13617030-Alexandrium_andersonii.AAC.1